MASPLSAEFWDRRYGSGQMPWDAGAAPMALERYLRTRPGRGARVLVPGCGSGYEIVAFARAGYSVTGIDLSVAAVKRARAIVGPGLSEHVFEGDFFSNRFDGAPFDLIYERTFLCALPPEVWPRVAGRSAELLKADGDLVGVYFFGEKDDGPPFGLANGEDAHVFGRYFARVFDAPIPVEESLPIFAGRERWQERRRRAAPEHVVG